MTTDTPAPSAGRPLFRPLARLGAGRTVLFLILGGVFWYLAALYVQQLGPVLFDRGALHLAAFGVTALSGPVFVWIAATVARQPLTDMLLPVAVMLVSATALDAVAMTYAPSVYGGEGPVLALGAAQIIWGITSALVTALLLQRG